MPKRSLVWHRDRLANVRAYAESLDKDAPYFAERYSTARHNADFLERQIAEAERRGLIAFDDNRFLVKKGERQ
jgi:hypothetical protein